MNHPHPRVARGLAADRIAAAPGGSTSLARARRSVAALLLLLACAGPAGASCPGADGAAGEPACPGDAAAPSASDAASSAPAATAGGAPSSASEDGSHELATAKKLIDQGEAAHTEEERKRAYEDAKRHADRAVELMPNDADARFVQFAAEGRIAQMGGIAVAALQLVKLNKQLDEVLRLDPNHANALAARGGMLMKLPRLFGGNTTKGVEYLEKAVALDSTAVGKRLELAEAYHIVGRDDDAKTTAQNALDVAKQLDQPDRVATCERFIVELQKSCSGCAVASIGR